MSANINLDVKNLTPILRSLFKKLQHYTVFLFILTVLVVYGFLVFEIRQLSSAEPDEDLVTEQLKTVARPRIDQDSINKIQQLQDQNIAVQSLFKTARDNPFQDN